MKKNLLSVALVAALAQPAAAITFPSLTTIYLGSGVYDDGSAANAGFATTVHCSNVSGQTTQLRLLVLNRFGAVVATETFLLTHGSSFTFSTHQTGFVDNSLDTGAVGQGVLNVESTQSGVFCSAMIVSAGSVASGVALHLVRVNPHPGTVE